MIKGTDVLDSQLPLTKRNILIALKERAELTADELANDLDISAVAVRRHLADLERDELVEHDQLKRAMGRPSFVFHLTESGHQLFPRHYERLVNQILETVDDLYGSEAIDHIFKHSRQRQLEDYAPQVTGDTLEERIEQLTDLRAADGYMASWERLDQNTYILHQYNCPILSVAKWCRAACDQEIAMLASLLGAKVSRDRHQAGGDVTCSYRIMAT